jgi:hypothetical protein
VEIGAAEVTPRTLGDTREDLVFTPLFRACRMADTRVEGGPIAAGTRRDFKGVGNFTQQGGAATCGVPSNASAVVMNVAAVQPAASGALTVHPFRVDRPDTATLNYTAGKVTRSEFITRYGESTPISNPQGFKFTVFSTQQTHVVIDVIGYFSAPLRTALECFDRFVDKVLVAGERATATLTCPDDAFATGGGATASDNAGLFINATGPTSGSAIDPNSWFTSAENSRGTEIGVRFYARCCRVPGL